MRDHIASLFRHDMSSSDPYPPDPSISRYHYPHSTQHNPPPPHNSQTSHFGIKASLQPLAAPPKFIDPKFTDSAQGMHEERAKRRWENTRGILGVGFNLDGSEKVGDRVGSFTKESMHHHTAREMGSGDGLFYFGGRVGPRKVEGGIRGGGGMKEVMFSDTMANIEKKREIQKELAMYEKLQIAERERLKQENRARELNEDRTIHWPFGPRTSTNTSPYSQQQQQQQQPQTQSPFPTHPSFGHQAPALSPAELKLRREKAAKTEEYKRELEAQIQQSRMQKYESIQQRRTEHFETDYWKPQPTHNAHIKRPDPSPENEDPISHAKLPSRPPHPARRLKFDNVDDKRDYYPLTSLGGVAIDPSRAQDPQVGAAAGFAQGPGESGHGLYVEPKYGRRKLLREDERIEKLEGQMHAEEWRKVQEEALRLKQLQMQNEHKEYLTQGKFYATSYPFPFGTHTAPKPTHKTTDVMPRLTEPLDKERARQYKEELDRMVEDRRRGEMGRKQEEKEMGEMHARMAFENFMGRPHQYQSPTLTQRQNNGINTAMDLQVNSAWMAIGFGASMLSADFMFAHSEPLARGGTLKLSNRQPSGYFSAPSPNPNSNLIAPPVSTPFVLIQTPRYLLSEFRRYTNPTSNDRNHPRINPINFENIIWAYATHLPRSTNSNPNFDPTGTYHGPHRGRVQIQFATGLTTRLPDTSIEAKKTHGLIMSLAFLILYPFGALWARYIRSLSPLNIRWQLVHSLIQLAATGATVAGIVYITSNLPTQFGPNVPANLSLLYRPHSLLGFTMVAAIFMLIVLGYLNRMTMKLESLHASRKFYKRLHTYLARFILLLGVAQTALGMHTMYPFLDAFVIDRERGVGTGRGSGLWIAWFAGMGFWMALVGGVETYWRLKVRPSKTNVKGPVVELSSQKGFRLLSRATEGVEKKLVDSALGDEKSGAMLPGQMANNAQLKSFTWSDISNFLNDGKLYVIANRKWVYDISSWMLTHPGGQVILHSVAGTDITADYFHQAGCEAEGFTASKKTTIQTGLTRILPQQQAQEPSNPSAIKPPPSPLPSAPKPPLDLTPSSYKHLLKARRTHTHTTLAIQKLSTLLCGTIAHPFTLFSQHEWRRYALVDSHIIKEGDIPVYKLQFCLLFPSTPHLQNEPIQFSPGQCVEIQMRVKGKDGKWVNISRYYTPIEGTLRNFAVIVRMKPGGALSPSLIKHRVGERQIRIRGPFGGFKGSSGTLSRGIPQSQNETPVDTFLLTAGSGFSVALQYLRFTYLPTGTPRSVIQAYTPQNSDELSLSLSDVVIPHEHLLDGWAKGLNQTTGLEGLFPVPVTGPPNGKPLPKVQVLNVQKTLADTMVGRDVMEGVALGCPFKFGLTSFVTQEQGQTQQDKWSVTKYGKPVGSDLEACLQQLAPDSRIVVCGPERFEGLMMDLLVHELGVEGWRVGVLSRGEGV
ncbi:hypothetical protein HDV05_004751 [Chytridiales sp. JEL 0842]|nr:hypothetical protein HDV05_004751 [Chytridiales sp. JEL 0842]